MLWGGCTEAGGCTCVCFYFLSDSPISVLQSLIRRWLEIDARALALCQNIGFKNIVLTHLNGVQD